ncbi:MAG: hypothetical protein FWH03_08780 [Firmicutes bacterium]|nr:hypothetical protein [Bacillota bacterium]
MKHVFLNLVKKTAIFTAAILMCLGLLAGCGKEKNFIIGYDNRGSFHFEQIDNSFYPGFKTVTEVAFTLDELKDLCDTWNNPAFLEESEYYASEQSAKIRSYDEAYFNENFLIIYSFTRGHSMETRIESIATDGSTLIVHARLVTKRGTFTTEAFTWLILIEVKNADIDSTDITTIEVRHR